MIRKYILYIIVSLLSSLSLVAQYYNTGQDPASIKWLQVNTEHFRFIFPSDYKQEALRTAGIFEDAYRLTGGRYGEAPVSRFPVIIHNHSVRSNGYVAWAPSRMEIYPAPSQNSIPLFHSSQLALHELTHVSQMQSLRQGVSKPLEYLFGEQLPGALAVFTPYWFLEGEAVVSESIFSYSGRGRQADFEKRLKALLLEKGSAYGYDKLLNGSYKDYTPDHYQFGYQMVAYTLDRHGEEVFPSVMENIARRPYTLNPFNISLKKNTGLSKKELFDSTISRLSHIWSEEDRMLEKSSFSYYDTRENSDYISYHSPHSAGKDSIIALKTSLTRVPSFVLLTDNGRSEKKLFTPGYIWPYRISVAWPFITWAEKVDDPRWDNRSYSLVKILNMDNGRVRTLSSRGSRHFSPSLSPCGSLIAISESSSSYRNRLLIMDSRSGTILKEIPTPGNVTVVNPSWGDNDRVVFISSGEPGEGIMLYSLAGNNFRELLAAGNTDIQSVALRQDTVFFIAAHSGVNNVFSLGPDGKATRLTSSRFGLSDLSLKGPDLLFADYSSDGNRIGLFTPSVSYGQTKLSDPLEPFPIKDIDSSGKLPYYADFVADTSVIEPYRKWQHLFNLHSWMPFYADLNSLSFENIGVSPGLTLLSQNHLSTLTSSIAYEYLNKDHYLHTSLLWEGRYPAVELDLTYGGEPGIRLDPDSLYYPSSVSTGIVASANIYLPLRFSSGRYYQTLYPSVRLSYINRYIYEDETGLFDYGQLYTTARFYFANLHRMAYRDIWPVWGQVIDIFGTWVPGDMDKFGPVKSLRTTLYTPGLFANHGFRFMLEAEKQEFRVYPFSNRISIPRGYTQNEFISSGLISLSADYALPLLYPDLNLRGLAYLKRVRANLFYDYSTGTGNYYPGSREMVEGREYFTSFGADLLADFYLLRMPFGFTAGLRSAWLPLEERSYFGMIFNIDIFGFAIGKSPGRPY